MPTSRPLAVGAAQRDLPVRRGRPPPTRPGRRGRGRTRGRRAGRATGSRVGLGARRRRRGVLLEVDDLDRAAGGKDDAADVVAVVCGLAHRQAVACCGPTSAAAPSELDP